MPMIHPGYAWLPTIMHMNPQLHMYVQPAGAARRSRLSIVRNDIYYAEHHTTIV
jgi:hypothetical protein